MGHSTHSGATTLLWNGLAAISILVLSLIFRSDALAHPTTVPMIDDGVMLKVPALLFDHPHTFLVDTGCSVTILNRPLVDRLGPSTRHIIAESPYQADLTLNVYRAPVITLGRQVLPLTAVAAANLQIAQFISGDECAGVLGMDILSGYVVTLNFAKKQFSISREENQQLNSDAAFVPLIPLQEGRCAIKATLNESTCLTLAVDSGSSSSISLNPSDWASVFGDRADAIGRVSFFAGVGNNVRVNQTVRLKTLRIGTRLYTNLLCSRLSNPKSVSHIGLGLLRRNVVVLDFLGQRLGLLPRTGLSDEQDDMSGLHLLLEHRAVTVYAVDLDSPADRAGIKAGDEIVSLNGKQVVQLDMQRIRYLLQQEPGAKISAVLRRDGKAFSACFQLKALI